MKAERITNEILDEAFRDSLRGYWRPDITSTTNMAKFLQKKYRIRIWKEHALVKEKMKAWWKSKPRHEDTFLHVVCGYIVSLGAPMHSCYCALEFNGVIPYCMLTICGFMKDGKVVMYN